MSATKGIRSTRKKESTFLREAEKALQIAKEVYPIVAQMVEKYRPSVSQPLPWVDETQKAIYFKGHCGGYYVCLWLVRKLVIEMYEKPTALDIKSIFEMSMELMPEGIEHIPKNELDVFMEGVRFADEVSKPIFKNQIAAETFTEKEIAAETIKLKRLMKEYTHSNGKPNLMKIAKAVGMSDTGLRKKLKRLRLI